MQKLATNKQPLPCKSAPYEGLQMLKNDVKLLPATSPNLLPALISPSPLNALSVETHGRASHQHPRTLNDEQRQLVVNNMNFARNLVNSINFTNLDPDDLYQEAYLAMCKAALNYNATNGAKFSTYIHWPIIGAVNRAIALLRGRETISIDDDQNDEAYRGVLEPSDSVWERMDDVEYVRELIWKLSKRDGDIIEYMYGLNGRPELSVAEIAALFGKSEHYIYKVLKEIFDQLDKMANENPRSSKIRAAHYKAH